MPYRLHRKSIVLEIGPGKGILTGELLKRAGKVVAVEKDSVLLPELRERFADELANGRLVLVEEDIRDFNPSSYSLNPTTYPLRDTAYALIANIPYYITGAIIRQFLTAEHPPQHMALLVQKEVAERIVAQDGKESLLSLSVKAYGVPRYVKTVKAGSFSPPPLVDSAILAIDSISRTNFADTQTEARFFELLHAGFSSKRKMLAGNIGKAFAERHFAECGVDMKARAEDLTCEQWLCLSRAH